MAEVIIRHLDSGGVIRHHELRGTAAWVAVSDVGRRYGADEGVAGWAFLTR